MSHDKLKKQIAVEREQLNQLLGVHRSLLVQCASGPPNAVELSALAAMLHAFYTGIENIFKRIVIESDGNFSKSESWHQALLKKMASPGPGRPAVLSAELRATLQDYLDFRHVFRQAYTFQLRWERMSPLVQKCEEVLHCLESELDAFSVFLDSH